MKRPIEKTYFHEGIGYPCRIYFRKGMRRITLRFGKEVDTLAVSAPYFTSEKAIDKMVESFLPKLLKKRDKVYRFPFGDDWMFVGGNRLEISFPDEASRKKYLLKIAKPLFVSRLRHYESLMGVSPAYRLSIRAMKSRFGSNSRQTHRISLALELVHYDPAVLDSVVVHELSHHFHFDHSEAFHSLCLRFCPDYPRLRKVLLEKDYGYHPDVKEE